MLYTKCMSQEGESLIFCTSIVICIVSVDLFTPSSKKKGLAYEGVTLGF